MIPELASSSVSFSWSPASAIHHHGFSNTVSRVAVTHTFHAIAFLLQRLFCLPVRPRQQDKAHHPACLPGLSKFDSNLRFQVFHPPPLTRAELRDTSFSTFLGGGSLLEKLDLGFSPLPRIYRQPRVPTHVCHSESDLPGFLLHGANAKPLHPTYPLSL